MIAIAKEAQAVLKAQTAADLVESLSRLLWAKDNPGKDCPPDRIPTTETLAAWLPEFPEATHLEAGERLAALYGLSDGGGCRWRLGRTTTLKPRGEWSLTLLAWERPSPGRPGWGSMGKLEEVHEVWLALPAEDRPKHPLAPLVAAWQERPRPGRANINRTDRILPARLAMVDHTDRRAGRRLFTPAAHAVERGGGQLKLPGFGLERTRITPALPLALYDLGGGSSMERGHGAPLALRLWVESILAVGLTDRANPWPTVLEIPLRDLLRKLYPSKRRPRPNEYWPRLMQAVEILDSTRIPWEDPKTGKGGLQRIVNVSSIPRGPGKLDDAVRIIVDLPPSSGKGPVVSPNLNRYGVQSAPLYRGLLNLAYLWFDPGRTRIPVRGGKHWLQVEDPERYERITNDLLIELFYPTSTVKQQTVLATRARKDLARLVKDGEARIVKGRLMPPKPRE